MKKLILATFIPFVINASQCPMEYHIGHCSYTLVQNQSSPEISAYSNLLQIGLPIAGTAGIFIYNFADDSNLIKRGISVAINKSVFIYEKIKNSHFLNTVGQSIKNHFNTPFKNDPFSKELMGKILAQPNLICIRNENEIKFLSPQQAEINRLKISNSQLHHFLNTMENQLNSNDPEKIQEFIKSIENYTFNDLSDEVKKIVNSNDSQLVQKFINKCKISIQLGINKNKIRLAELGNLNDNEDEKTLNN
jgi:hypothetical protein